MVAIIDYGAGNIKSVEKAVEFLGQKAIITKDYDILLNADKVILPGVGAFGDAMLALKKYGLVSVIEQIVEKETPFLGICLGLQLLFEESEESPGIAGLGLLHGRIKRLPDYTGLKIPHMGWNTIKIKEDSTLFKGVSDGAYVYFVHSYYLEADNKSDVAAFTEYSTDIHAAVEKGNLYACQFHPEKSSSVGLKILNNFLDS